MVSNPDILIEITLNMEGEVMTKLSKIFGLVIGAMMLASCGKGFQTAGLLNNINGGNGSQASVDKVLAKAADEQQGQPEGGQYSDQLLIKIDKVNQAIVLILPLPPIFVGGFESFEVANAPGVVVSTITNEDGGDSLAVTIPLRYLSPNTQFTDFYKLPNGDALPFMPVGEMNGFAISFPQKPSYRLHLYVAVSAAAVFVETPDMDQNLNDMIKNLPIVPKLGFPIKNKKYNTKVGWVELVLPKGGSSSGVYVATQIPAELAHLINDVIRF